MTEPRCFLILYFRPVRYFLNLGKRTQSQGARSGEYGGCGISTTFSCLKNRLEQTFGGTNRPFVLLAFERFTFWNSNLHSRPFLFLCVHNLSDAHCAFNYTWHLHVFCSPYLVFVFSFGLIVVHPCLVASRQTSDYHSLFKYYICQNNCTDLFSSPEHKVLMVSYCDRPLSVSRRPLSDTTRLRSFIFGIQHHQEVLYQSCSNYSPEVKIDHAPGVTIFP